MTEVGWLRGVMSASDVIWRLLPSLWTDWHPGYRDCLASKRMEEFQRECIAYGASEGGRDGRYHLHVDARIWCRPYERHRELDRIELSMRERRVGKGFHKYK